MKTDVERARTALRVYSPGWSPTAQSIAALLTELEAARRVVAAAGEVLAKQAHDVPGKRGPLMRANDELDSALAAYRDATGE